MSNLGKCCCYCNGALTEAVAVGSPAVGTNLSPYRPACGSLRTNPIGVNYRHVNGQDLRDVYENTTEATYESLACGGSFTSYPWINVFYPQDACGDPPASCETITCPSGSVPSCGRTDDLTITPPSGPGTLVNNQFTAAGTQHDFALCRKKGFKNVQAFKAWHGMFGFDVKDAVGHLCDPDTSFKSSKWRTISIDFESSSDVTCFHQIFSDSARTTRTDYIKHEISGTELFSFYSSVGSTTGTIAATKTAAPTTPQYTTDTYSWDGSAWVFSSTTNNSSWVIEYGSTPQVDTIFNQWDSWQIYCGTVTLKWLAGLAAGPGYFVGDSTDLDTIISAINSGNLYVNLVKEQFSISETQFQIKLSITGKTTYGTNGIDQWDTYEGVVNSDSYLIFTITLSDEYTDADVYADAKGLVNAWNLTDDAQYPWRTDGQAFVAPLVTRNELAARSPWVSLTSDGWSDPDTSSGNWTDPLASIYDGSAVGGPLTAGYGVEGTWRGVFDFNYDVWWRRLCDMGGGSFEYFNAREKLGAYTPSYLPANCPRWTKGVDLVANFIRPCPFVHCTNAGVYLQKWAETQIPQNSFDFARPYGADRFLFDEAGTVYQLDAYSSPGNLIVRTCDGTPVASHTFTGVWGGDSVSGFYTDCTTDGSGILTLGTLFSAIPTGWAYFNGDAATYFGKLRWESAPGFGNRLACTATYDSGTGKTTFAVATSPYIVTGDHVDALTTSSVVGANLSLTRVSDNAFTMDGDYHTATLLVPHAYYVTDPSTGAPLSGQKYYFANNTPKGDFVWRQWTINNYTGASLSTSKGQSCLTFTAANPSVMAVVPSAATETFAHAFTVELPTAVPNGQTWMYAFEQWMADPLALDAHLPCSDTKNDMTWGTFEAVLSPPANYGVGVNETAPTPPDSTLGADTAAPEPPYFLSAGGALDTVIITPTWPWQVL